MRAVLQRLTYANVVATLALFLALGGGAVYAAGKIGSKGLKANAVTAGKIKRNAVTAVKIRANAVTAAKIKNGAVNLAKLAAGTNVLGTAGGGPVPANGAAPVEVPLTGTTTFNPAPGTVAFLGVEAKGINLARVGAEDCEPRVIPIVNGSRWNAGEGALRLRAFAPTAAEPSGLVPTSSAMGPLGLTSPGAAQAVSARVIGSPACAPGSGVSVAIVVTQAK